jgi:formate dehydrogenase major subunit
MKLSRRRFLQATGVAALGLSVGCAGVKTQPVQEYASSLRKDLKSAKASTTVCPYCAVGCGAIVHAKDGKVINIEGDPDHPISEGSLCSKGSSLRELATSPNRADKVLYRAPNSDQWEEKTWEWAFKTIAQRIKDTRDKHWVTKNKDGQMVNRVEALASVGSAAMDNEECWLYSKMLRALGLVYVEHQARI